MCAARAPARNCAARWYARLVMTSRPPDEWQSLTPPTVAVTPIGVVRSPLVERKNAPRQGDEGAPDAWIHVRPELGDALTGLAAGDELVVLTWFHQSNRDVLKVHPRGDPKAPLTGVFATRSPDRPNPL